MERREGRERMSADNGWENSRCKWGEWKVSRDPLEAEVLSSQSGCCNAESEFCYETEIAGGWQWSSRCIRERLPKWMTESELEKEADKSHQ